MVDQPTPEPETGTAPEYPCIPMIEKICEEQVDLRKQVNFLADSNVVTQRNTEESSRTLKEAGVTMKNAGDVVLAMSQVQQQNVEWMQHEITANRKGWVKQNWKLIATLTAMTLTIIGAFAALMKAGLI